jgi:ribosomal protein S18 acetylase RimI-like enzyme
MELSIRKANIEDAALIAEISHQTFYETFASENTKEDMDKFLNEQFTKGRLMLEVGAIENTFLLAYVNDKLAGYVKLRESKWPQGLQNFRALEVARIYCLSEMIGKGVGKALMQASIDLAKEKKKDVVWLGVWEKNQRAIDFYIKWGFEKFGEQEFLLGNDLQNDWLMKMALK